MNTEKNRGYYVRQIMVLLRSYIPNLVLAIIIKSITMILPYLVIAVLGNFVNEVFVMYDLDVKRHIVKLLVLIVATIFFSYLDTCVSHDMSFRIVKKLRNLCFEKIERVLPATSDNMSVGDYGRIINGDVDVFEWFYAHIFVAWIATAIALVTGGVLICSLNPFGLLVVLLCAIAVIYIPKRNTAKAEKKGYMLRRYGGELNATVIDGILGMKDVISNQFVEGYNHNLMQKSEQFDCARAKFNHVGMNEKRLTELVMDIGIVCSLLICFFSYNMDIGEMLSFILLITAFFGPLQQTLSDGANYGFVYGAAKRVYDLLNQEEFVHDDGNKNVEDVKQAKEDKSNWQLDLEKVEFRYPKATQNVLQGVTFSVRAGESVALVAQSGGGKTTLANLLQRFWDYQGGYIGINGIDIKDIQLAQLRSLITVVSQDIYLFNMSVRENLLMAKPNATEAEIIEVCKKAKAWDFICDMPKGLDTLIGERGECISGGQRQRLALAQAFLKDTSILVFDEATSNLDVFHEREINETIKQIKEDKIIIIIAHRLATIQSADKIVFLKNGVQAENGTFDEIRKKSEDFNVLIGQKG